MRRLLVSVVMALIAVALFPCTGCKDHEADIEGPITGRRLTSSEEQAALQIADGAIRDVRTLLPTLPKHVHLRIEFGKNVIPETGENATALQPAEVVWTIDPDRDVMTLIRAQLRPTLFHELHHLVRDNVIPRKSLMDTVVTEGMATAFERDFGGVNPPWGTPPPAGSDWTREVMSQPANAPRDEWLIRSPDGRRWIGMRVGTQLVDRASKASGHTSAWLVTTPTSEVLRLADVH